MPVIKGGMNAGPASKGGEQTWRRRLPLMSGDDRCCSRATVATSPTLRCGMSSMGLSLFPPMPPATEHRKIGKWLAKLAGDRGADAARSWRKAQAASIREMACALSQPYGDSEREDDGVQWYLQRLCMDGIVVSTRFHVGVTPDKDAQREPNQKALDRLLSHGARVHVDARQRGMLADGYVRIERDWGASRLTYVDDGDGNGQVRLAVSRAAPPADLIFLQIGHTDGTRTYTHLRDHGAVARWAYGSEYLYVFMLYGESADLRAVFTDDRHRELQTSGAFSRDLSARMDHWHEEVLIAEALARLPADQRPAARERLQQVFKQAKTAASRSGFNDPVNMTAYLAEGMFGAPNDAEDDHQLEDGPDGWVRASGGGAVTYARETQPLDDL